VPADAGRGTSRGLVWFGPVRGTASILMLRLSGRGFFCRLRSAQLIAVALDLSVVWSWQYGHAGPEPKAFAFRFFFFFFFFFFVLVFFSLL